MHPFDYAVCPLLPDYLSVSLFDLINREYSRAVVLGILYSFISSLHFIISTRILYRLDSLNDLK